jgi:protein gp37
MDNAGQPDDAGGPFLDWIIVGGESGPKARPFHLPWARRVIRQCQCAHVPVWMKQVGARPCIDGTGGDRCDDHTFYKVRDRAGADPMEWPDDLRVQQFPEVRV